MKKQKKSILVLATTAVFIAVMFLPGLISAGDLEPIATPGSTMKTLDQIPPTWSQKLPVSARFELVLDDQAVLDKETGLVWAKGANPAGVKTWQQAMDHCRNVIIGYRKGWRLPTAEELASLLDMSSTSPKLPTGHPFEYVQWYHYWSSTTYEGNTSFAWTVSMGDGSVLTYTKTGTTYVWPVRGGN